GPCRHGLGRRRRGRGQRDPGARRYWARRSYRDRKLGLGVQPWRHQFERPPETPNTSFRTQMAYRQAGLLVAFLHDTDPAGFARTMSAIMDGRPFAEAVTAGYGTDLLALWLSFAQARDN